MKQKENRLAPRVSKTLSVNFRQLSANVGNIQEFEFFKSTIPIRHVKSKISFFFFFQFCFVQLFRLFVVIKHLVNFSIFRKINKLIYAILLILPRTNYCYFTIFFVQSSTLHQVHDIDEIVCLISTPIVLAPISFEFYSKMKKFAILFLKFLLCVCVFECFAGKWFSVFETPSIYLSCGMFTKSNPTELPAIV